MFTRIEGLPDGSIGFAAFGRITGADRQTVLEPTIDMAISTKGKVRLLYVAGPEFIGYDRGGLYDETIFGTRHFTDFEKIAFVADDGPWGRAASALDGLMPVNIKVFPVNEIEGAKAWLAE